MSARCPRCGNTDQSTLWEDNFWSGCNKCGWSASCENATWVPSRTTPGVLEPYRSSESYQERGYMPGYGEDD